MCINAISPEIHFGTWLIFYVVLGFGVVNGQLLASMEGVHMSDNTAQCLHSARKLKVSTC